MKTGSKIVDMGWNHKEQPMMDHVTSTIYSALGIDYSKKIVDTPSGRAYEYQQTAPLGGPAFHSSNGNQRIVCMRPIIFTILFCVCAALPLAAQTAAPEGMAQIPAGKFWMGRDHSTPAEAANKMPRGRRDDRPANHILSGCLLYR